MRKGFTMIELLTTMGIIVVLAAVMLVNLLGRKNTTELNLQGQKVVALLREAQSRAMSQASSSAWGVHFDNASSSAPFYALFAGTYSTSSSQNHYPLSASLMYSNSIPAGSSLDVTFAQITGRPSASSSVIIATRRDANTGITVSVDITGAISVASGVGQIISPTVVSVSPSSLAQSASNQDIVIAGTGFQSGAVATSSGTGITINSTTFNSATQVTANITIASNATVGARDITIINPDGGSGTGAGMFTVTSPSPTVTSASPSSRVQGASNQDIVIAGTGFQSGAVATSSGTGITINSTTFNSATQVTANISIASNATVGARTITVTNTDTQAGSCVNCFTVNATPTITSLSPSSGGQAVSGLAVAVIGTGFQSGAVVTFSGTGITITSTTFASSTQINLNLTIAAAAASGARDVTVTNPDSGTVTSTGAFTVNRVQQNTGYLLGSGTPTFTPSANWIAPNNWFSDEAVPTDAQVAHASSTSSISPTSTVKGFSFGIPTGSSIDKICVWMNNVSIQTSGAGTQAWYVALSYDGGTSFTAENGAAADISSTSFSGLEQYYQDATTTPGTSDPGTSCTSWGRTWSVSEMSATNFGVRLKATNSNSTARQLRFDVLYVKVYYTPA